MRLYLNAYYLGLVKNEDLDKHKAAMCGKFMVLQFEPFLGGGAWLAVGFVDDPSFFLRFWVYSFVVESDPVNIQGYDVRGVEMFDEPIGLTSEEIKEIIKDDSNQKLW